MALERKTPRSTTKSRTSDVKTEIKCGKTDKQACNVLNKYNEVIQDQLNKSVIEKVDKNV
jgi:hypothetical protein